MFPDVNRCKIVLCNQCMYPIQANGIIPLSNNEDIIARLQQRVDQQSELITLMKRRSDDTIKEVYYRHTQVYKLSGKVELMAKITVIKHYSKLLFTQTFSVPTCPFDKATYSIIKLAIPVLIWVKFPILGILSGNSNPKLLEFIACLVLSSIQLSWSIIIMLIIIMLPHQ